jgi:hypothetical protein
MTEEYTPSPPLPLTESEAAAIDSAIADIPAAMRRHAVLFVSPREMEDEPGPLGRLDKVIVALLSSLKKDIPEDVAEKLFERMMTHSVTEQHEDAHGSIGIMCYRLFDSMQCMVAIKEKFRGKKSRSIYGKSHATDQLKVRGLLR